MAEPSETEKKRQTAVIAQAIEAGIINFVDTSGDHVSKAAVADAVETTYGITSVRKAKPVRHLPAGARIKPGTKIIPGGRIKAGAQIKTVMNVRGKQVPLPEKLPTGIKPVKKTQWYGVIDGSVFEQAKPASKPGELLATTSGPTGDADRILTLGKEDIDKLTQGIEIKVLSFGQELTVKFSKPQGHTESVRDDPLAAARGRGAKRVQEILDQDDMLNGEEFAKRLGLTRQAVDTRRKQGKLIALQAERRGIRYPDWQISDEGTLIPGLEDALALIGDSGWTAYRILCSIYPDSNKKSNFAAMRDGKNTEVLKHLEAIARGDHTG